MEPSTVIAVAIGGFVAWKISRAFAGKVAPDKARELVKAGAKLVDVRSPGEHAGGHIEGSVNVPVGDLSSRLSELGDKEKPIVVYCASGMRSASAASMLRSAGFKEVHDLGSIGRWPG